MKLFSGVLDYNPLGCVGRGEEECLRFELGDASEDGRGTCNSALPAQLVRRMFESRSWERRKKEEKGEKLRPWSTVRFPESSFSSSLWDWLCQSTLSSTLTHRTSLPQPDVEPGRALGQVLALSPWPSNMYFLFAFQVTGNFPLNLN